MRGKPSRPPTDGHDLQVAPTATAGRFILRAVRCCRVVSRALRVGVACVCGKSRGGVVPEALGGARPQVTHAAARGSQVRIAEELGLQKIINLMHSEDVYVQQHAAGAVANLAFENPQMEVGALRQHPPPAAVVGRASRVALQPIGRPVVGGSEG